MPLRINRRHMSQPTGWAFPLSTEHTLLAEKLDELVTKLTEYRVNNGLPVGDPEHDIATHYSPTMPWLIEEIHDSAVQAVEAAFITLFANSVWATSPHQKADQQDRERRWDQCKKCPLFRPLPLVSSEVTRRIMVLAPWMSEAEHGYCAAHRWVCSVAVGLKEPGKFGAESADGDACGVSCWQTGGFN